MEKIDSSQNNQKLYDSLVEQSKQKINQKMKDLENEKIRIKANYKKQFDSLVESINYSHSQMIREANQQIASLKRELMINGINIIV